MGYCSCKVPPELTNFTNPKEHGGDSWPWDTIKTLGCVSNNLRTNDFPVGRGTDGNVVFLHMKTWGVRNAGMERVLRPVGRTWASRRQHPSKQRFVMLSPDWGDCWSRPLSQLWLVRGYLCLPLCLHCLPQHHLFSEDFWQESGDRQANPPKWRLTSHTFLQLRLKKGDWVVFLDKTNKLENLKSSAPVQDCFKTSPLTKMINEDNMQKHYCVWSCKDANTQGTILLRSWSLEIISIWLYFSINHCQLRYPAMVSL